MLTGCLDGGLSSDLVRVLTWPVFGTPSFLPETSFLAGTGTSGCYLELGWTEELCGFFFLSKVFYIIIISGI